MNEPGSRSVRAHSPPVIPPPPAVGRGKRGKRRRGDKRWLIGSIALAVGVALGVAAYAWVPRVPFYFDFWVAMALS